MVLAGWGASLTHVTAGTWRTRLAALQDALPGACKLASPNTDPGPPLLIQSARFITF